MSYYTDPATSHRVEVHTERWGRRYRGLAITLSVLVGAVGGWVGLALTTLLSLMTGTRSIVSAIVMLAVAAACWVGTSAAVLRGLSGPRR